MITATIMVGGLVLAGYVAGRISRDGEIRELKSELVRYRAREYGQNRVWKA